MSSFQWKAITYIGVLVGVVFIQSTSTAAQPQTAAPQINQPNRISIEYVATEDLVLREYYRLLRDHRALEKIQEMLSPFHLSEELTIKAAECGCPLVRRACARGAPTRLSIACAWLRARVRRLQANAVALAP